MLCFQDQKPRKDYNVTTMLIHRERFVRKSCQVLCPSHVFFVPVDTGFSPEDID